MDFRTKTQFPPTNWRLNHADRLTVMGSCFAEHIGLRLQRMKFRCEVNPFGVLYNPLSIAEALHRLHKRKFFSENELYLFADGGWNSWLHHSKFSMPNKEEALNNINDHINRSASHLSTTDTLIITWGTAWVYRLVNSGEIVGNCHKQPDKLFIRQQLSVEQIIETYTQLFDTIWAKQPQLHILFTISPIRHLKDGLHGNQLSKATLLLAMNELCKKYPDRCHYFPAYEIVIDELRDYRFYAEDMAHPSQQAIDYVWECFMNNYMSKSAKEFITNWEKISRALDHKPFHPEAEEYKNFVNLNLQKIIELKKQMPYLEVQNEISLCHTLLKPSLN